MPEKDKITPEMRKEIYNWIEKRGEIIPETGKKVSPYTVAPMFNISHTMVYKIWKEGPESKTDSSQNPAVKSLAGKLVKLFGEAAGDISDEIKTDFMANLSEKDKKLIRRLSS